MNSRNYAWWYGAVFATLDWADAAVDLFSCGYWQPCWAMKFAAWYVFKDTVL